MSSTLTNPLTFTRLLDAPIQKVFDAWTQPALFQQWFGPSSCQVEAAEMEVQPGGSYRLAMNSTECGQVELRGEYREVSPPNRIAFSWKWMTEPMNQLMETEVVVELREVDGKTELTLTHTGLPDEESRQEHSHGWTGSIDCLLEFLG